MDAHSRQECRAMPPHAANRYSILPRPAAFDRRALAGHFAPQGLSLELERQLSAVQRRRQLHAALRSPSAPYAAAARRPRRLPV
jgi:hypothetical protein